MDANGPMIFSRLLLYAISACDDGDYLGIAARHGPAPEARKEMPENMAVLKQRMEAG
jgi:hypothetical protein